MKKMDTNRNNMDLSCVPERYVPGVNESGTYVDEVGRCFPSYGIVCDCTGRVYAKRDKFMQHIRCRTHVKWLEQVNLQHKNYFRKCQEQEQIIRQQRLLIAELEKKVCSTPTGNLIDF